MEMVQLIVKLGEVFTYILLGSVLIERSLQTVFNWRLFVENLSGKGFKGPISFIVSLMFVIGAKLDIVSYVFQAESSIATGVGYFVSGLLVAAGSKAVSGIWGDIKKLNRKEQ